MCERRSGVAQTVHMPTVLLAFLDGTKEFVSDTHVHGMRDGNLLLAAGLPGAGLDAEVMRSVPLTDLTFAETCIRDEEQRDGEASPGGTWSMGWGNSAH